MTVTLKKPDPDAQWFASNGERQAHIRKPVKVLMADKKHHVVRYMDECEMEYQSLGDHNKDRRRILLWKVPPTNPFYDPKKPAILKIPTVLYADESVEDRDDILLPFIDGIMREQL